MKKLWNGKLSGLFSCFIFCLKILIDKILNKWTTFVFKTSVNKCGKSILICRGVSWKYPLKIGRNAFVGSRVNILSSVSYIGNNSVIGTGSVVTKDVPDNAIVAGNPARIIKYRE